MKAYFRLEGAPELSGVEGRESMTSMAVVKRTL